MASYGMIVGQQHAHVPRRIVSAECSSGTSCKPYMGISSATGHQHETRRESDGDGQQRPFAQKDSMKCQIDHTVQTHCSAPRDDGVRPMVMRACTTSSRLVAHIDEEFRLTILQDAAIRRTARRRA